jgi:hypothetical protein
VITVINFTIPQNIVKYLSKYATGGFSRTQLHDVSLVSVSSSQLQL